MNAKEALKSKTIRAGGAVVLIAAVKLFAVDLSPDDAAQVIDSTTEIASKVLDVVTLLSGLVVIFGRYRATRTIKGSAAETKVGPTLQG